jgi:uncharacterized protein (TIRG00374 family)
VKASARLRLALKTAFVVVLLYILTQKGFISLNATRRAFAHWDRIALAVAALVSSTVLSVVRWHWLLRERGIDLRPRRTLALAMIGNFFNLALPGAISGDVVKGFYIAKERPGRRDDVFASILFDRVAGLSGLVLLAAAALFIEGDAVLGTKLVNAIQIFITIAAVVVVVFYGYLFLLHEHHDPLLGILRALERRVARVGSLIRLYLALRRYRDHPAAVVWAIAVSVVIHCLVCFQFLNLWRALEPANATTFALLVVVPVGLLVTTVPIAPAGLGTGHAAFGWLFLLLGSKMGANVFSVSVILQLVLGGLGGLVYLRFRPPGQIAGVVLAENSASAAEAALDRKPEVERQAE